MKPRKITVEPSADHPNMLDIRDAMEQVLDFFDLLTEEGDSDIVWNLVRASANSPFVAEGVPMDLRTKAPAFGRVENHLARIDRGLGRMQAGEPLDVDFPIEKKAVATRMLKRNLNGIGRTCIEGGDGTGIEFRPQTAKAALDAMLEHPDEDHEYLFATFSREEMGSIDGRIVDLRTNYDEPSLRLKEHLSGREIPCRISPHKHEEIGKRLTAHDVWEHRRARVQGLIRYDENGKIVRLNDCDVKYIDVPEVRLRDLRDPEFTGGLPAREYLDRLRENDFD